jgi:hypothetical protein
MALEHHLVENDFKTTSNHSHFKPPLPLPPTSQFIFVTTTETSCNGRPPIEAQKIIRRHAITTYHRLKPSLPSHQTSLTGLSLEAQKGCKVGKFRLEGHGKKGKKYSTTQFTDSRDGRVAETRILDSSENVPRNVQTANFIDPFGVAALQLDRPKQELIEYCTSKTILSRIRD